MEKLVRDKIPEIIRQEYGYVDYYKADEKEYKKFLFEKLLEEAEEVFESNNKQELIEEIADLYEVIDTIIDLENLDKKEIVNIKNKKNEEKGAFKKGFILKKDN